MKKAILYSRVSTDEQAEKGYSLEQQKMVMLKYCDFNKIEVIHHYVEDFSAKTFNRPQWKILISYLKKIKAKLIS